MDNTIKKGDVVWGKIQGFPWWPAMVAQVLHCKISLEKKFLVNFIGDRTHASLPENKIEKFMETFKIRSKTNKKKLTSAILTAKRIYSKEAKFAEHDEDLFKIIEINSEDSQISEEQIQFEDSNPTRALKIRSEEDSCKSLESIKKPYNQPRSLERIKNKSELRSPLGKLKLNSLDENIVTTASDKYNESPNQRISKISSNINNTMNNKKPKFDFKKLNMMLDNISINFIEKPFGENEKSILDYLNVLNEVQNESLDDQAYDLAYSQIFENNKQFRFS